uniref:Coenzyme Q biosynthesis protein 4 homolog n=1 Tax=Rhabditophanes sp. KR3021 TaxID=114890 RepID=A0AC35UGG6_9BILA
MAAGSAATAITDPRRGDMVAAMGEVTAITPILTKIRDRMMKDVEGKKLLELKPRISESTINRDKLRTMERGTFGREYVRYRETHDFTHTILKMKPNMIGEVTVKFFEGIQLGLPMCVSAGIFGAARLGPK